MKKILRILGILVLSILVLLLLFIAYIKIALPNVGPAPEISVSKSQASVARGEYLANHVMVCMDCHSLRNPDFFTIPLVKGTLGEGGERFDQTMGFPGVYYSANITPAGIGSWTEGEIYRAITTGVKKDGTPIFPIMPYPSYGFANPEDVKSVIAYLRTLAPIDHKIPPGKSDFPMSVLLNTIPKKAAPMSLQAAGDSVGNGKYLFTIAGCHDCHTPFEKGKFDESFAMAGGRTFPVPGGKVTSANITPDMKSGIGSWSREMFVQHFTMYRDSANANRTVNKGELQTIMPWTLYGKMTDTDLRNIYSYIRTLKPVSHTVIKWKAE